jgi:hypothetical protein
MNTLYHSERFAVVHFELEPSDVANRSAAAVGKAEGATGSLESAHRSADMPWARGGYEIVDKLARKEIFLEGAMAEHFREGVQALIHSGGSEDEMDDYMDRYTALAQQPVVLH